jgi:mono/diheme cytochrome c family protein
VTSIPARMRLLGIPLVVGATALVVALAGCSAKGGDTSADPVKGKQLFVQRCGSCHVLSRAGTKGTTGPNLDAAFARARQDGFGTAAIRGIVYKQILYPNRTGVMPAKLVTGDNAHDVAAYVGRVAAKGGKDTGALATVGQSQQKPLAKAANGTLTIPADPNGQLLYMFKNATAPAGALTVNSPNKSQTPHDISVQGQGTGKVVKGGGTSTVKVDLKPGKYTFLCTVPGHAQAGMKGTLTVK